MPLGVSKTTRPLPEELDNGLPETLVHAAHLDPTTVHPAYDFASAGAAASLAYAGNRAFLVDKSNIQSMNKGGFSGYVYRPSTGESQLSAVSSKAAYLAAKAGAPSTRTTLQEADGQAPQAGRHVLVRMTPTRDAGPQIDTGAILAANGAMSGSRRRAVSAPSTMDSYLDTPQVKLAATCSQQAIRGGLPASGSRDQGPDAGKIQSFALAEDEGKRREETLHAAAVSMAKQMYSVIPRLEENMAVAGSTRDGALSGKIPQQMSPAIQGPEPALRRPASLHEAAQRRASERIAKIRDEAQASQDHYDIALPPKYHPGVAQSRTWSSSNVDATSVGKTRSRLARSEISTPPIRATQADKQKHAMLMEAAKRNVHTTMQSIDQMIYAQKGRPTPKMMREWEERASERSKTDKGSQEVGLVSANGGKGEKDTARGGVHALARSRVQPTLDELADRADERRAREIEFQLDGEKEKRQRQLEKERDAEIKSDNKRLKKTEKKAAKDEKAVRAERKILDTDEPPLWKYRLKKSKDKEQAAKREINAGLPDDHASDQVTDRITEDIGNAGETADTHPRASGTCDHSRDSPRCAPKSDQHHSVVTTKRSDSLHRPSPCGNPDSRPGSWLKGKESGQDSRHTQADDIHRSKVPDVDDRRPGGATVGGGTNEKEQGGIKSDAPVSSGSATAADRSLSPKREVVNESSHPETHGQSGACVEKSASRDGKPDESQQSRTKGSGRKDSRLSLKDRIFGRFSTHSSAAPDLPRAPGKFQAQIGKTRKGDNPREGFHDCEQLQTRQPQVGRASGSSQRDSRFQENF